MSAKVRDGAVVTDGNLDLPDGATVTVVTNEETGFDLSPEQEAELLETIEEADAGKMIPAAELFARLRP